MVLVVEVGSNPGCLGGTVLYLVNIGNVGLTWRSPRRLSTIRIVVIIIETIIEIMATTISLQEEIGQCTARYVSSGTSGHVHLETDAIGGMYVGHVLRQER